MLLVQPGYTIHFYLNIQFIITNSDFTVKLSIFYHPNNNHYYINLTFLRHLYQMETVKFIAFLLIFVDNMYQFNFQTILIFYHLYIDFIINFINNFKVFLILFKIMVLIHIFLIQYHYYFLHYTILMKYFLNSTINCYQYYF